MIPKNELNEILGHFKKAFGSKSMFIEETVDGKFSLTMQWDLPGFKESLGAKETFDIVKNVLKPFRDAMYFCSKSEEADYEIERLRKEIQIVKVEFDAYKQAVRDVKST